MATFVVTLQGITPEERFDGNPWTSARIEQSSKADGPWSALETQGISPQDPDPSEPAARDFTTALATLPDGWFRVVFLDASLAERESDPQHYPPLDGPLSLEEFKAYSNIKSDAKDELAQAMLNAGVAFVARLTNGRQLLDLGQQTLSRRPDGRFVRLPDAREITSVKVDGATVAAADWVGHSVDDPTVTYLELPSTGDTCVVAGKFGLVPLPDELRSLVLAAAARHYYRRQAGFADSVESEEFGIQSFFRSLPADMQATIETWRVVEAPFA